MLKNISTQVSAPALPPESSKKIFYIDRLKIILTALVVLHHVFVTYGAPGGWYFSQKSTLIGAVIPMTMIVTINQSFFMGFFFFLSAYFIRSSYEKKGASRFVTDRLLRLGIPLIFYSFILSPILSYLVYYFGKEHHISFFQYLKDFDDWIDFGVLWFVAALLLFTLIYVLWRMIIKNSRSKTSATPSFNLILLFAAATGVVSFFTRTIFPVGWTLKYTGFQLGYFPQYIALFILGLVASKNKWLDTMTFRTGRQSRKFAMLLLLFFPIFFVIEKTIRMPQDWFTSGFHWQQLLFAVWEQLMGFSIIIALLGYGKQLWDKSSALQNKLSRCAFAVYIFHPLIIIFLSLALRNWAVEPAVKFLLVAPLAVTGSFLLASVIILIPGVKKII
jgi:surface polysaccharide O-acyltransferase-like enzyme